MNSIQLAKYIDHTLLKPDAVVEEIIKLCKEALDYNFASVCVNPCNVMLASKILKGSSVKVCTVIGFPLGANTITSKVYEAEDSIKNGAQEIDMVINIGKFKEKNYTYVLDEIRRVVCVSKGKAIVKVIIETCLLEDTEIVKACEIVKNSGADFIKTSTGFSKAGASVHNIQLMKGSLIDSLGIKASGGIRNFETAKALIDAGATRIGASASIQICDALNKK